MTTPLLKAIDLCYRANDRQLIRNISFQAEAGELIGIIGPNGAGKSTLLKNLIGFLKHSSGDVLLNGDSLHSLSGRQRARIAAYMAQHSDTPFPFTVKDIIALGAENRLQEKALSPARITEQIEAICHQLSIKSLLPRKLTELSGGEKQLVHFARILMQETPLMLLDEPTSNLDIGHETQLMQALKQQSSEGKTVLVAMHNLNTAANCCDRLLLISQGQLAAEGTPAEVLKEERIEELYQQKVSIREHPVTGALTVQPVTTTDCSS